MYTDIKTFEDACQVLNLDASNVIPDFSFYPEEDKEAMIAHAKLVLIAKALNEGWVPDWKDYDQYKYYPWFDMDSSSGDGFSYDNYGGWYTHSFVGSRLCFQSREIAKYAGTRFEDLYKSYFVKA